MLLDSSLSYLLDDNGLTAKELLHTIAPTYHLAKVPPGFPSLDKTNTDNFNYGTRGRYIKVVAFLNQTVKMVENYIELTKVQMNFTYDKQQPENGTWRFSGKGKEVYFIDLFSIVDKKKFL